MAAINLDADIMSALTGEKITWPQALEIRDRRKASKTLRRQAANAQAKADLSAKTAKAIDAEIAELLK